MPFYRVSEPMVSLEHPGSVIVAVQLMDREYQSVPCLHSSMDTLRFEFSGEWQYTAANAVQVAASDSREVSDNSELSCFEAVRINYLMPRSPGVQPSASLASEGSPLRAVVQRRNKAHRNENAEPATPAFRVHRKPVPALALTPQRAVLGDRNLNISAFTPGRLALANQQSPTATPSLPPMRFNPAALSAAQPALYALGFEDPFADPFTSPQRQARNVVEWDPFVDQASSPLPQAVRQLSRRRLNLISSPSFPRPHRKPVPAFPPSSSPSFSLARLPQVPRPALSILDFNLLSVLGQGGQGKVYLATLDASNAANPKRFAVKVMRKSCLTGQLRWVLQEQRILKELGQLGHPNVIGLEGSFHDDRFFYLVNEFCDGGDLQAYIEREGAMDEDIARFYAAEMVLGIQHLHRHSIIHRDLKLANVLMMASGHIVIADMGLVRCFNGERVAGGSALRSVEEHFTNSCCGTLTHMAPEVLAAEIYSYEVDWWALGIMVYNMLFTEVPFLRPNEDMMTRAIMMDDPLFPPSGTPWSVSPGAISIMKGLLEKSPVARLKASGVFAHEFFQETSWDEVEGQTLPPPVVPGPSRRAFKPLNMQDIIQPGRNFFPGSDPYPCYNFVGSELRDTMETEAEADADTTPSDEDPFADPVYMGQSPAMGTGTFGMGGALPDVPQDVFDDESDGLPSLPPSWTAKEAEAECSNDYLHGVICRELSDGTPVFFIVEEKECVLADPEEELPLAPLPPTREVETDDVYLKGLMCHEMDDGEIIFFIPESSVEPRPERPVVRPQQLRTPHAPTPDLLATPADSRAVGPCPFSLFGSSGSSCYEDLLRSMSPSDRDPQSPLPNGIPSPVGSAGSSGSAHGGDVMEETPEEARLEKPQFGLAVLEDDSLVHSGTFGPGFVEVDLGTDSPASIVDAARGIPHALHLLVCCSPLVDETSLRPQPTPPPLLNGSPWIARVRKIFGSFKESLLRRLHGLRSVACIRSKREVECPV